MSNIHIVTVATKDDGYLRYLEESCIRHGTQLTVLGMGKPWTMYSDKYKYILEKIDDYADDDIFCFVDAYDVLMVDNVEKLKQTYLQFVEEHGRKIVVTDNESDIKYFGIHLKPIEMFRQTFLSKGFYGGGQYTLNSGTYIGFVSDIKVALTTMMSYENIRDDQIMFNKYMVENEDKIYVDDRFFTIIAEHVDMPEYPEIRGFFIHRPANAPMNEYLRRHGYNFTPEEEIRIYEYNKKSLLGKLKFHGTTILNRIFN